MKTIALIGGMNLESTTPYYRRIDELTKQRLGGFHRRLHQHHAQSRRADRNGRVDPAAA